MGIGTCLSSAEYQDNTLPPANRRIVFFQGTKLKAGLTTEEVESQPVDANGRVQPPVKVRQVLASTDTYGRVELAHLANWEEIRLRVHCADGRLTDWVPIKK